MDESTGMPQEAFERVLSDLWTRDTACSTPGTGPAPGAVAVMPGRLGRYEVLREVARGGMGVVLEARDPELGRRVAIKLLRTSTVEERVLNRFRRESALVARLAHPNIVAIHDVGHVEGVPYIVMEFVEGKTLQAHLRTGPPLDESLRLLQEVALGVHHAHQERIVHRDLKPSNILVDREGRARVADFGIAKPLDTTEHLTALGAVVGTPGYMAPEQLDSGDNEVGPRADVWALGVMLYEVLAGHLPFQGPSPLAVYRATLEKDPPEVPGGPRELVSVAMKAMEKDPDRRYATALEFAEEIGRFRAGEPVLARPIGRARRLLKWSRRHPYLVAALSLSMVGGTVGAMVVRHYSRVASRAEGETRLAEALLSARVAFEDWKAQAQAPIHDVTPAYEVLTSEAGRLAALIREEPSHADAWHWLGVLHFARGDLDEAERSFNEALERDPSSPVYRFRRGMCRFVRWRFLAARERVVSRLPRLPLDANPRKLLGVRTLVRERLLVDSPDPPIEQDPVQLRGVRTSAQEDLAYAVPLLTAGEAAPWEILHAQAILARMDGRAADAEKAFREAAAEAGWRAGRVLLDSRWLTATKEVARVELERGCALAPSQWTTYIALAELEAEEDTPDAAQRAVEHARTAARILPSDPAVALALVTANLFHARVLARASQDPSAPLAEAEEALGRLGAAPSRAGIAPGMLPLCKVAVLVARGREEERQGGDGAARYREAREALDRAIAEMDRAELYSIRSVLDFALGERAQGMQDLQNARSTR